MAKTYEIAIVGIGKIAQDQHLPVIAKNARFKLAGLVSQRGLGARRRAELQDAGRIAELRHARSRCGRDLHAAAMPAIAIAREAMDAGKHVMLEKPPAATIAGDADLDADAAKTRRVAYATWHSQYNAAVDEAKRLLAGQRLNATLRRVEGGRAALASRPGMDMGAGGFGVFDPGINALSILTKMLPAPMFVKSAELIRPKTATRRSRLWSFPQPRRGFGRGFDRRSSIGARTGPQSWNIDIETESGLKLALREGGSKLSVDGKQTVAAPMEEYEAHLRAFRRTARQGRKRHALRAVPARRRRLLRRQARGDRRVPLVTLVSPPFHTPSSRH